MVSCPTWSRNLGRTLRYILLMYSTLITHCTAGYLGQILRSTCMFIWVSKSCKTRPDSRASFCLKCNLFRNLIYYLMATIDTAKSKQMRPWLCNVWLFCGSLVWFFCSIHTLMHEMSSGQFLTKDIFFPGVWIEEDGGRVERGLNKQNTIHKKFKCSMQTFHILDAFWGMKCWCYS